MFYDTFQFSKFDILKTLMCIKNLKHYLETNNHCNSTFKLYLNKSKLT